MASFYKLCVKLKFLNSREEDVEEEEENETEEIDEDDEIDDDPNVISKLLETDEDSDEDFQCSIEVKKNRPRPRRSTRLNSSYGMNDSDGSSPALEEDQKYVLSGLFI